MAKNIIIPQNIVNIMQILLDKKYECYVVGGAIRDFLLNKNPKDYDLTTNATPEEIISIFNNFSEYKILELGKNFGTIGLYLEGETVEITTYRKERDYKDNRHPSSVEFINDLKSSLERRDFTVNTLCCDIKGNIIDYFGGLEDLEEQTIRCVGNPNDRFNEDALRILRAIRFACCIDGFSIEENTSKAIEDNYLLLSKISKERIQSEFNKIICSRNCIYFMEYYKKIFNFIFDRVEIKPDNIFGAILFKSKLELEPTDELSIRLALLLQGNLQKTVEETLKELRYKNEIVKNVSSILDCYSYWVFLKDVVHINDTTEENKRFFVKLFIAHYGFKNAKLFIKFLSSNFFCEYRYNFSDLYNSIIENNECCTIPQLALKGTVLKNMGYKGEIIGEILFQVLLGVISNALDNEVDEVVIEYIRTNYKIGE